MIVGCPKEIKPDEFRVGLTPGQVREYVRHGHTVLIENLAGAGSGFDDQDYRVSGADLVSAGDVWLRSDLVIKVKEPLPEEYPLLRQNQILFTYLHLAANPDLTQALLASGTTAIAYETIEKEGLLPCLKPMSEIAGRLAVQEGAKHLEKPMGGRGVLLGGVPGTPKAKVVILGAGAVGANALKMAVGLGATVSILDLDLKKLTALDDLYANRIQTLYASPDTIERELMSADLVIGAVLIPGGSAPKLVTRDHLKRMAPGAVLVDVAIDQGGCFESSHLTYHHDPTFVVDGIVHYCVGNMPGAVPVTATAALTQTTFHYGLALADLGLEGAIARWPELQSGLNTQRGTCAHPRIAVHYGLPMAKAVV